MTGSGGGEAQTKHAYWPEGRQRPGNRPLIKDLNFPKVRLSLSSQCSFPNVVLFSVNFLLYSLLFASTGQARLGTLTLTAGSCGPVVRTLGLGNYDLASGHCSLLLTASQIRLPGKAPDAGKD